MHERVSKSSAWTPTSIQKKSKSLHAKPSTSIQPKQENISSQQQEMLTYSTAGADLLAANIMRSLEPKEPESSEISTGKPRSESGQAAFPSIAASIPSTPVVQSQEIGIQRQCSECAKEQSTEEGKDIDEISAAASGIQTKLTIGAPPNPYQQAANQMAEVMSKPILYAPVPQVQRFSPQESQIQLWAASAQSISPMMQMSVEQQAQMSALLQRPFRGEGTQASFEPVQAKLTVGEPGDKYEQEADAVAHQVVEKINAPTTEPSVQRQSIEEPNSVERERALWGDLSNIDVNGVSLEVYGATAERLEIIRSSLSALYPEHLQQIPRIVVGERVGPIGRGSIRRGGNSARRANPVLSRLEITNYALDNKIRQVGEVRICFTLLHEVGHWVDWGLHIYPSTRRERRTLEQWFQTLDYPGVTQGQGERSAEAYWHYFTGDLPEGIRAILESSPAWQALESESEGETITATTEVQPQIQRTPITTDIIQCQV